MNAWLTMTTVHSQHYILAYYCFQDNSVLYLMNKSSKVDNACVQYRSGILWVL